MVDSGGRTASFVDESATLPGDGRTTLARHLSILLRDGDLKMFGAYTNSAHSLNRHSVQ